MSTCHPLHLAPQSLPARPDSAGPLARLVARIAARRDERDRRLRLARLLDYDDRLLDDMGLRRESIEAALALPPGANAIEHLHGRRAP